MEMGQEYPNIDDYDSHLKERVVYVNQPVFRKPPIHNTLSVAEPKFRGFSRSQKEILENQNDRGNATNKVNDDLDEFLDKNKAISLKTLMNVINFVEHKISQGDSNNQSVANSSIQTEVGKNGTSVKMNNIKNSYMVSSALDKFETPYEVVKPRHKASMMQTGSRRYFESQLQNVEQKVPEKYFKAHEEEQDENKQDLTVSDLVSSFAELPQEIISDDATETTKGSEDENPHSSVPDIQTKLQAGTFTEETKLPGFPLDNFKRNDENVSNLITINNIFDEFIGNNRLNKGNIKIERERLTEKSNHNDENETGNIFPTNLAGQTNISIGDISLQVDQNEARDKKDNGTKSSNTVSVVSDFNKLSKYPNNSIAFDDNMANIERGNRKHDVIKYQSKANNDANTVTLVAGSPIGNANISDSDPVVEITVNPAFLDAGHKIDIKYTPKVTRPETIILNPEERIKQIKKNHTLRKIASEASFIANETVASINKAKLDTADLLANMAANGDLNKHKFADVIVNQLYSGVKEGIKHLVNVIRSEANNNINNSPLTTARLLRQFWENKISKFKDDFSAWRKKTIIDHKLKNNKTLTMEDIISAKKYSCCVLCNKYFEEPWCRYIGCCEDAVALPSNNLAKWNNTSTQKWRKY